MTKWYENNIMSNDIIISSRVSLLRNIIDYPFALKITEEQSKNLIQEVRNGFFAEPYPENYVFYPVESIANRQKAAYIESYILSRKTDQWHKPQGLIVAEDESACVRINSRDHLNIVAMAKGDQLEEAYKKADQLDDWLNKKLDYAFSPKYGYLSSSPSNMGTGMRASYFLHLPFMESTGLVRATSEELNKYGYVLRGVYGEDSDSSGCIYQLYNQKTLGMSETELITSLKQMANQVITQERDLRTSGIRKNRDAYEDSVYKAYGILKYARSLTLNEATDYLSNLRIGLKEDLIHFQQEDFDVYPLMLQVRPAILDCISGKNLGNESRGAYRAQYIRKHLPDLKV